MVSHNNNSYYQGGRHTLPESSGKEYFEEYRSIEVENGNKTLRFFFDKDYKKVSCELSFMRYYQEFESYQVILENPSFSSKLLKAGKMLAPFIQSHLPTVESINVLYATYFAAKYLLLNERELEFFILTVEEHFSGKEALVISFPSDVLYGFMRGYICGKEALDKVPEHVLRVMLAFFMIALEVKQLCSFGIEERMMYQDVFPHLISFEAQRFAEQLFAFSKSSAGYNLIKLNDIHKILTEKDSLQVEKVEPIAEAKQPEMLEEPTAVMEADPDSYFNFEETPGDCAHA